MNKEYIRLWVIIVIFIFLGNLVGKFITHNVAKSFEYCNEDGYWVKTGFTGNPIGIAIDKNGKPITCEYKVKKIK